MLHPNRPSGFVPVQYLNGTSWNGQSRLYSIIAGYGTELNIGDPVISSGTADANGIAGINIGAGTGALRGVITGLFDSLQTTALIGGAHAGGIGDPNIVYRPASHANVWYATVVDDPMVVFEIQEESDTTQMAATDVGANQIAVAGSGNGFVSGWQIAGANTNTPATEATYQLRLLGLVQSPAATNTFGAYAKWLVKINTHELQAGSVGTVGI